MGKHRVGYQVKVKPVKEMGKEHTQNRVLGWDSVKDSKGENNFKSRGSLTAKC